MRRQYHPIDRVVHQAIVEAPFGLLGIVIDGGALVSIDFLASARPRAPLDVLARHICHQLERYFRDPAAPFDLPLNLIGTPFQKRVWRALREIPSGEIRSYGDLARHLRTSPRAIGGACRANPIPIVVPCHRVVAQAGIGGFSGKTRGQAIRTKEWLLSHEHASVEGHE